MDYQKQQQWYERAYRLGENRISNGYGWSTEPDPIIARFLDFIPDSAGKRGLDLGCGQGRHTFLLAERGFDAYGVDYIKRAIDEAWQEVKKRNLHNIHFSTGNILSLPYDDNFFDVIIDWSVLDHVKPQDWYMYKNEAVRVLKNKGFLILGEFSASDERVKNKSENFSDKEDSYSHFFTQEEIQMIFGDQFEIIQMESHMLTTPPVFLMDYYLLQRK